VLLTSKSFIFSSDSLYHQMNFGQKMFRFGQNLFFPIAEPHTHHGKEKETHELIFSWLSWLAVLLVGAYARRRQPGGVRPTAAVHYFNLFQRWRPFCVKVVNWTRFYGYDGKLFEPENMLWALHYFLVIIRVPIFAFSNKYKSHSILVDLFPYSLLAPRQKIHRNIPKEFNQL